MSYSFIISGQLESISPRHPSHQVTNSNFISTSLTQARLPPPSRVTAAGNRAYSPQFSRFACALVYRAGPSNPPVLQATTILNPRPSVRINEFEVDTQGKPRGIEDYRCLVSINQLPLNCTGKKSLMTIHIHIKLCFAFDKLIVSREKIAGLPY